MADFCSACGAPLRAAARFCPRCGRPVATPVVPAPQAAFAPPPPPPGTSAPPPGVFAAAPAPAVAAAPWPAVGAPDNLPPAPPPWSLEISLAPWRAQALAFLERSGCRAATSVGRAVQRTVRAAMLDTAVYREVAADPSATLEALAVAGVAVIAGAVGPMLLTASLGQGLNVTWLVRLLAIQAAALAGFAAAAMALSPTLTRTRLQFLTFLRPLAYAEVPGLLGFVPVVGSLLGLWRLVTTLGALRSVLGCETGAAIGLLVAGLIGGTVAGSAAWPLLRLLGIG